MHAAAVSLLMLLQVPASAGAFLETAREASAIYRDQAAAILAGYRRIGDDFPAMGEHWIHVGRVFDGVFDPALPEVLTYVPSGGRPTLAGVAYALPLLDGENPPAAPVAPEMWHDHYRTLEEETLLPAHDRPGDPSGARIAMLHAWVWLPNPEGVFAADNWAAPYLRLGLDPARAGPLAGRALSLATGGDGYFGAVVRAVSGEAQLSSDARAALAGARGAVESILAARPGAGLSAEDDERLAAIWRRLWSDVRTLLDPGARERLDALDLGPGVHAGH